MTVEARPEVDVPSFAATAHTPQPNHQNCARSSTHAYHILCGRQSAGTRDYSQGHASSISLKRCCGSPLCGSGVTRFAPRIQWSVGLEQIVFPRGVGTSVGLLQTFRHPISGVGISAGLLKTYRANLQKYRRLKSDLTPSTSNFNPSTLNLNPKT